MADRYGAYLTLRSGNVFMTPQSIPICLYSQQTFSSVSNGVQHYIERLVTIPDASQPVIPFVLTSRQAACAVWVESNGQLAVRAYELLNTAFTMTVYLFTIFPQPMPNPPYGLAIWDDETGDLVITHESKILTDVVTVGTAGANGGIYIDETKAGKWAIIPDVAGQQVWRITGGGPGGQLWPVPVTFTAAYNGSSTRIFTAAVQAIPSGSAEPMAPVNAGNAVVAVEVSKYS
ncbi:hypothetical protein U0868_00060 [Kluyvera ascorbata]|uniref:hypothetical protein n=1 Tax=Kluyvera ascorbata TaxID=51288 RepID=UPI002ABCB3D6|nr:hypothetical protein [Kluyvera ascorbata]MDZ4029951.1 hypothetical protein [Kluyvera ascorbata]